MKIKIRYFKGQLSPMGIVSRGIGLSPPAPAQLADTLMATLSSPTDPTRPIPPASSSYGG